MNRVALDNFRVSFRQGEVVFSEGEPGECAYIVELGTVDLFALINGESVKLTQFNTGELFGEMSLIDNNFRSATAVAATNVTLLCISRDYFERNIRYADDVVNTLLKVVLNRYREMRGRLEQVANGKNLHETMVEHKLDGTALTVDTQVTTNRIQQEQNLQEAFAHNQLELFYQPIISIKDKKIAGCESLIRWRHPERGLVSPLEFVGLAEDTGLIVPIGAWIIEEACNARNRFIQHIPDLYVSVNLSAKQFETAQLADEVAAIFERTGVEKSKIYLEITESTLMSDPLHVAEMLCELKELNSVIALDDFGTGYSSFSYLHRFPIDVLKIDQSFVFTMLANNKSKEIVRTLSSLAHSLGMKVIAEGIEREEDLALLAQFGVDFGQGYYIAKPMPEAEFIEFMQRYG